MLPEVKAVQLKFGHGQYAVRKHMAGQWPTHTRSNHMNIQYIDTAYEYISYN